MNFVKDNESVPPESAVSRIADISIEELVSDNEDMMNDDQSGSSVYHPAHTDSLASHLSQDISYNNMSRSKNSSYTSVVSGLDSDKTALQHQLLKCEGIKVQLEFSEDFDGDRDDMDLESSLEMDILWANPVYLRHDTEGKKHIYIPNEASTETGSANELGENPLMNKLKKRKRRKISKSCGADGNLQPLKIAASEGRIHLLHDSSESECEDLGEAKMMEDSEEIASSSGNEGHQVQQSDTASGLIASVPSSGDDSEANASDTESDGSEYDVDYMGRWDIFWPMMSKIERKMVGAPSEVELNYMESGSFVISPSEMDDSFQLISENEGTSCKTDVEIHELVEDAQDSQEAQTELVQQNIFFPVRNDPTDDMQPFPTNFMESAENRLCCIM